MNRYRVLVVLAALLASAGAVHAQVGVYYLSAQPGPAPAALSCGDCPAWHAKALQEGVAALQRLRTMCGGGQQTGCCEAACTKAACCAMGLAGGVLNAQGKACACAKACACCESCKEKKDATPSVQAPPMTPDMMRRLIALDAMTRQPVPVALPPMCMPPAAGTGIVQVMPVPAMRLVGLGGVPMQGEATIMVVQLAQQTRPAHFVTPELDAHCERMHHRGDTVVLEGNVLMICKKHAQPIRIEAQRVIINMKDGSFGVDSNVQPVTTTTFGVQRTSAIEIPAHNNIGCTPIAPNPRTMPAATPATSPLPCPATWIAPYFKW